MGKSDRSSGVICFLENISRKARRCKEEFRVYLAPLRETLRSVGAAVELFVEPAKHACFGCTQRLDPAVDQKLRAAALEWDLLSLFDDRSATVQIEFISFGHGLVCL